MKLPPVRIRMSETRIEITDTLINRTVTFDPRQSDFQKTHPALYGAWAKAYEKQ